MIRKQIADWSTINAVELAKLPKIGSLGAGRHYSDDMGACCAGDPPGFPTYFLQHVYAGDGNEPRTGPIQVIIHPDLGARETENADSWRKLNVKDWDSFRAWKDALMLRLWHPLPIDHPRTVAWIQATFSHHRHCYHISGWDGKDWHSKTTSLIWPGGCLGDTPFGMLKDGQWEVEYARKTQSFDKWTVEEQEKFVRDINENNDRIKRLCEAEATPDHHDGTHIVRRYYPDFQPTAELIDGPDHPGNWWEVMSERPTPANCPGQYSMNHPCNGSWCQMCGWHEERKAA